MYQRLYRPLTVAATGVLLLIALAAPALACSTSATTPPPTATPDIPATVDAEIQRQWADLDPSVAPPAGSASAPAAPPSSSPSPPQSLGVLWEIDESRVFVVPGLRGKSGTWSDREPIVLRGCRLSVDAPTSRSGSYLFSRNGQFSNNSYLVYIGGIPEPSLSGGVQKGKCYEMVLAYEHSRNECFFWDRTRAGIPRNLFDNSCPSDANKQSVPSFRFHSNWGLVDGKLVQDDRPTVREIATP